MSLRNDLSKVVARDSRYSIHAYTFVFEALDHAQKLKRRGRIRSKGSATTSRRTARYRSRIVRRGARLGASPIRTARLDRLESLGNPHDRRPGRDHLQPDRSRRPEQDSQRLAPDFNDVFDFESAFRRDFVLGVEHVGKDMEGA